MLCQLDCYFFSVLKRSAWDNLKARDEELRQQAQDIKTNLVENQMENIRMRY